MGHDKCNSSHTSGCRSTTGLTKLGATCSAVISAQVSRWKMGSKGNPVVKPPPKFNNFTLVPAWMAALATGTSALSANRVQSHLMLINSSAGRLMNEVVSPLTLQWVG